MINKIRKIVLLLLLLIIIPFNVDADEIENFFINATLQNNGDLEVEEYFNMTGFYNGFEKVLVYANPNSYEFRPQLESYGGSKLHNGNDIILEDIKAVDIDSNFKFKNVSGTSFKKVDSAEKGDYGVYTENKTDVGKNYKIFLPSKKEKAFYIKYIIKDLGIVHNDVGELGWNMTGSGLNENILNLKLTINFPNNAKDLRVWAHGPLSGSVHKVNNDTLVATINNVNLNRAMDVRATFDKEIISNSTKKTNVNALDKILLYETDSAARANYERDNHQFVTIENINSSFVTLESRPTRANYNYTKSLIERIKDEKVKITYNEKLLALEPKVIKYEEGEAIEAVSTLQSHPNDYYFYKRAVDKVSVLTNQELRNELMAKIDIVKQEMVRLEQKREQRNYNVCIILLVINFLAGIYIYSKFGKKHNPTHKFTYYRDIPNNYHPTITEYLLKRKITNKSISAAILNLIEKEYITYEKISDDNYKLFDNSKDKEDIDKLDKQLLEIIFLKKDEITLKQLNNRNNKNSNSYYKKCRKYLDDSRELAKKEGFYDKDVEEEKEKKNKKKTNSFKTIFEIVIIILAVIFPPIILLTIFIGIFISLIGKDKKKNLVVIIGYISETILLFIIIDTIISNHFVKTSIGYMLLAMLLIIILFIYVKTVDRRTQKGEDEYNKCKAFNKFLKDFGNFDDKDLIEISLWEKYLVFATLFGCSSKLLKSMKLKLVDVEDSEELADLINITTSNAFSSSLSSSIGKSISTTYYSSGGSDSGSGSNYSSGSGGGGGFSSGGGSFGGGSGGGRF